MHSPARLLSLLACSLLACGGGGGGGVDSGLPADRKGSELSAADETALCDASADHLASLVSEADAENFACVLAGIAVASMGNGSVETCQMTYDLCIDQEPMDDPAPTTCALGFELSTCNATVADIEACLTEKNEATDRSFSAASCNDITAEPAEPTVGPACMKARADCPGIA
jgi:hypothetical protein